MTPFFIIRRATDRDAEAILDCLGAAFAPYRERYTPPAFADTVLSTATIQRRLDDMYVFVAVSEGDEVAGTIGCAVYGDGEGHLRGMAVRPGWQGTGVAARLLEAAESHLRESGCRRATLDTTEPLRRAVRFYEGHGYRATGTVTDFFGMPLFEYAKSL